MLLFLLRAYRLRGWVDMRRADAEAARPWLVRAIAAARGVDDRPGLAEALASTSIAENMAGRPTVAAQLLEEADTIAVGRVPDPVPVEVLQAKAVHAFFAGDLPQPPRSPSAGEQLCRASGDLSHLVQMLIYQGQAAILTGDVDRADGPAGRGAAGGAPARRPSGPVRPVDPAGVAGQHDRAGPAGRAAARRRRRSCRRRRPPD